MSWPASLFSGVPASVTPAFHRHRERVRVDEELVQQLSALQRRRPDGRTEGPFPPGWKSWTRRGRQGRSALIQDATSGSITAWPVNVTMRTAAAASEEEPGCGRTRGECREAQAVGREWWRCFAARGSPAAHARTVALHQGCAGACRGASGLRAIRTAARWSCVLQPDDRVVKARSASPAAGLRVPFPGCRTPYGGRICEIALHFLAAA
jgi:hypothetical protein